MSRDIRSFFKPLASKPAVKKPTVILSDDEDEKSSKITKKTKITEKKRRKHALSDSDDEETVKKVNNEEKDNHKKVSTSEIFGKAPIKREAAPKVVKKAKEVKNVEKKIKTEIGFHDDDLDSSLIALDESLIEESLSAAEAEKLAKKALVSDATDRREKSPDVKREKEEPRKSPEKKKEKKSPKKEKTNGNSHDTKTTGVKRKSTKTHSKLEVDESEKSTKKAKLDESCDMFEEIIEKKKQNAALYQQFLHRGGARNPGSKEIPEGADFCLAGLSFLVTGVLDSLERDEADELIKKYGGRLLHSVSKKLNYVILGDQPGPAKLSKAESLKIPILSEDELLEMIRTRPAGKSSNVIPSHSKAKETVRAKSPDPEPIHPVSPPKTKVEKHENSKEKSPKKEGKVLHVETSKVKEEKVLQVESSKFKEEKLSQGESSKLKEEKVKSEPLDAAPATPTEALVEKYRPQTIKQLIGQQGDKSLAKKLHFWLSNWHKNRSSKVKPVKPSPWAKNDDGGFYKAALLSGPPGIGKTTSAYVVAKELGFDLLEFNASDTRSKKLLKDEVSDLLSNTTVKGYFTNNEPNKFSKKHVLLMDEVDGMAGNEDRGGLQELIALIKSTDIPIMCICNDRNNPKMRTLSNYTFELRYQKPRIEQIKAAMMSLCYKENIKINPEDLSRLIESTNQDIRQVINHLAILGANIESTDESGNKRAVNKDLKLGPWDVVRKVFSAEEHKKMSIHDKSDLFFHDYSIAPLFVQENYLSVVPSAPKTEILERMARSAESLCIGDLIDNAIRSNGAWSLLPTQAMFSSVIPGSVMSGHITGQIVFPSWLGRNSKRSKMDRLLQEVTVHSRITTGASKEAINLDYLPHLRDAITRPLINEDVETSIGVMNQYHFAREDLDSILEISLWPGSRNPMQFIETKVKSAFTRAYNKNAATGAYALNMAFSKKKKGGASQDEEMEGLEEGEVPDSEEEDDIDVTKMMKTKKASSKKASSKNEDKPSTSKRSSKDEDKPKRGKGRGKAK